MCLNYSNGKIFQLFITKMRYFLCEDISTTWNTQLWDYNNVSYIYVTLIQNIRVQYKNMSWYGIFNYPKCKLKTLCYTLTCNNTNVSTAAATSLQNVYAEFLHAEIANSRKGIPRKMIHAKWRHKILHTSSFFVYNAIVLHAHIDFACPVNWETRERSCLVQILIH